MGMKMAFMSDLHGSLIDFKEKVDLVCIAGDIVPLEIQNDVFKSIAWFSGKFVPWAEGLDCAKVIFIGGNHDFFLQRIVNQYFSGRNIDYSLYEKESAAADVIKDKLMLPKKIIYLQDTVYNYNHKKIYGTPWIPELSRWAFYKSSEDLKEVFEKIPEDVDVLLTHSPGKHVNDTGVSLQDYRMPEYGSQELSEAVFRKKPKYWFCGHVHSGNHIMTEYGATTVANVSIKDENYRVSYVPLIIEI